MSAGCPACVALRERAAAEASLVFAERARARELRRAVVVALVTFASTALVVHYVLGAGVCAAPRTPVVVVVDCRSHQDLCSAALSAAMVSGE